MSTGSYTSLILSSLFLASSLNLFSRITSLIVNFWVLGFKTSKASTCSFPCSSIVFLCFSKAFPKGEYVNLFYYYTLNRWQYLFICKTLIFINFLR